MLPFDEKARAHKLRQLACGRTDDGATGCQPGGLWPRGQAPHGQMGPQWAGTRRCDQPQAPH